MLTGRDDVRKPLPAPPLSDMQTGLLLFLLLLFVLQVEQQSAQVKCTRNIFKLTLINLEGLVPCHAAAHLVPPPLCLGLNE